jgi:hypothetical protein
MSNINALSIERARAINVSVGVALQFVRMKRPPSITHFNFNNDLQKGLNRDDGDQNCAIPPEQAAMSATEHN